MKIKLDEHVGEIARGATTAMTVRILGGLLGFGFDVLVARMLGTDGAGRYFLAVSMVLIGSEIGRLGTDATMVRFVASSVEMGNWLTAKSSFHKCLAISVFGSIVASVAIWVAAAPLAEQFFEKPDLTPLLRLSCLAIVPLSIMNATGQALRGLKDIRGFITVTSLFRNGFPLVLGATLIPLYGVEGAIWSLAISFTVASAIGYGMWKKKTDSADPVGNPIPVPEILKSCLPLVGVSIASIVMRRSPIIILGRFAPESSVGILGIAQRVVALLSLVLTAVNSIAAPKFAAMHVSSDRELLARTVRRTTAILAVAAFPVFLVFVFGSKLILSFFGPSVASGATVLVILATGRYLNVFSGPVGILLVMTGHERLQRNTSILTAIICVIICLYLIPDYGSTGAAAAIAVALTTQNLIAVVLVRRNLGIWSVPAPWKMLRLTRIG